MKVEVDLVDVGGGNVGSVSRCLQRLGVTFHNATADNPPTGERPVIVPGVGAFGAVMNALAEGGLDAHLKQVVAKGTPYLGICVGMQVLFDSSEESPGAEGLGLIKGQVVRFRADKVPQIGWNRIQPTQSGWEEGYVYFVNSYYPAPTDESVMLYKSNYGNAFCAAVAKDNITAFQFHPEKSGHFGEQLLRRWLDSVN